jgi:hypothetical protein
MKSNGMKSMFGDHSEESAPTRQLRHPLDNVLSPAPQNDALLRIQTGLFELGRNRALQSGALEPVPDAIGALEEHARAIARDTFREQFDPDKNLNDRMHQAEYERLLKQREEIEHGVAHATANVHDAERALAVAPKAGAKPETSNWLAAAFIVAITITVAPTLHDFVFFGIPDDLLAWFGSSTSAAFVAMMLTWAILTGRRTKWGWVGVTAGIALGLGLGMLRLSSAQGAAEVLFAIGLTVVEVSAVLLLEWLASGLRVREDEWQARKVAEDKAIACCDAEMADLERRQKQLQEVSNAIGQKIAYVEDRTLRNIHLPELEALLIKAVLDGYNAGIAQNVGRVRGAGRWIS